MDPEVMDRIQEKREQAEKLDRPTSLGSLVASGEWEHLGENEQYQQMGREGRILTVQKAIDVRRGQLDRVFTRVVAVNPPLAEKYLPKIRRLRFLTSWLDESLVWEAQGQIGEKPPQTPRELKKLL